MIEEQLKPMDRNDQSPTRQIAESALAAAASHNPGNWISHSRYAAQACENIARACQDLDPEKAYVFGLLHDIGRQVGIVKEQHQIEGYHYCMQKGWGAVAKICLTHSHPLKDVSKKRGEGDLSPANYAFIKQFIENVDYDDYDRLVQLCDCLSLPTGFCIVEKRFVDVGIRYGVHEHTVEQWTRVLEIKAYFETHAGGSIYRLLPGLCENMIH